MGKNKIEIMNNSNRYVVAFFDHFHCKLIVEIIEANSVKMAVCLHSGIISVWDEMFLKELPETLEGIKDYFCESCDYIDVIII